LAAIVVGLLLGVSAARAAGPSGKESVWEGTLQVRPGVGLRLVIHLTKGDGGAPTGTLDSPDEGFKELKLSSIALDKSRFAFDLNFSGARFDGKLNGGGTEAIGTWTQHGTSLPLTLTKKDRATPEPKTVGQEQIWEGKLSAGAGIQLRVVVRLAKTESGEILGTFESLDQSAQKLKLSSVTLDKSRLAFELKLVGGKYEGKLNAEGTEATGTWSQGGAKLPLTLKTTDKVSEVRRPQTPKPPYPYKSEAVTYPNKSGAVTLAGTLTTPSGPGRFPALILISGSGAQDRDETIFQHRPFLVLADTLTRRGVAVLRVDDRGVGGSTGSTSRSTSEDFAGDVLAGIAFLKSRPEIDSQKIGLAGHSEGGLIAPMVAARSNDVAFIVLLAGTGLPGDEVMYAQGRLIGKVMGADEKALDKQRDIQKQLFEIVKTETNHDKLTMRLRQAIKTSWSNLSEEERKAVGDADSFVQSQARMVESPWFRFFLTFDPRPTLALVRCPVLALNGEKDLQVPPKENLAEIEKALKKGGNARVTVKELPGLNHLFQTCKTGSVTEYGTIEETIAPVALKTITDWVVEQVKGR
jgi:pimeloyl-ACP methyl ester carboxylesterase